jgi:TolA-binding protein
MNEYQVPLVEQLKSVPDHARFVQEEEFSSAYYPVGTLCHQAADRIAELEKKLDDMAGDIMTLENQIGTMTGYGHN